jgi:hypothetical protein
MVTLLLSLIFMIKTVLLGWLELDTQAFSASGADMDGAELTALDTLQQRLAGDAVGQRR